MNSLDILKQELINQKTILEEKGITVSTQNTNPSPSEITSAIQSISFTYDGATATEEDVIMGKTFYAQTSQLKTGTLDLSELDKYKQLLFTMITYNGSREIIIPTESEYTNIRDYCYSVYDDDQDQNVFYKHNLTIPENIKTIGTQAFFRANLTGTLTVPATCTTILSNAFRETNVEEMVIYNGLSSSSTYFAGYCNNLKKLRILEPASYMPGYAVAFCSALEEIHLPTTLTTCTSSSFYNATNTKFIKFTSSTPPTVTSTTFKTIPLVSILVPYEYFNEYYTSTNYRNYDNPMFGHGEFTAGDSLPSTAPGYTITWHATFDDVKAGSNPVTSCSETGTMYAIFTPNT